MSKLGKSLLFVTVITSLALAVFPVAAQITKVDEASCKEFGISCTGKEDTTTFVETISTIVNALLILVAIVAAIYIVLGGIRYIFSEGEESQTKKAKNTIIYAVIGLIVIGLSAAVVNFVILKVIGDDSESSSSSQPVPLPN